MISTHRKNLKSFFNTTDLTLQQKGLSTPFSHVGLSGSEKPLFVSLNSCVC
jgi:hypothetical protein